MIPANEHFVTKALTPMRRAIARRMAEASRDVPHFRMRTNIDMGDLEASRERLNRNESPSTLRITLNDLFIKVVANALIQVPEVNIQFVSDEIRQFSSADIAIITAVPGGLTTPVIRAANQKSIQEISREARQLIHRARRQELKMEEVTGGSFSISNLSAGGIHDFDAIINIPQCAILAVGPATQRLTPDSESKCRVVTAVTVTLSLDHRVLDGLIGARFLSLVKQLAEEPTWLA